MGELAFLEPDATRRLKDSEASLQALIDAVQDYAIFRLDPQGRVATWNRGAQRIQGYTAAEILGRSVACFYLPEDVASGKPEFQLHQAVRHGRFEDHGWQVRGNGSRFWANVVITALRDEPGRLQGFARVTRDVTDQKQAEDLLRQREQTLDSFFRASSVGLAILDRDLRYQRISNAMAEMNGRSSAAHIGKTVSEVVPGLADQMEPRLRQVLETGERLMNHEMSGPVPNQEDVTGYWSANFFPIRNPAGKIEQLGAVIVDITELRRAEDSLRHLSSRLMELQDEERRRIARELHDSVGQALTAVKLNLELITRELDLTAISPRARQAFTECGELATQCAADTRTISYLLHPPLLDERGLASAVRWYVDGFARRSGIEVSLDLPNSDNRLPQAHETTLFRVLQEGLTNIHRHSGSAKASVRLELQPDRVTLELADQGHGMPAASLRACRDSARVLGVGISGMRERVRQLGGQLYIYSSTRGTTVTASLPLGGS